MGLFDGYRPLFSALGKGSVVLTPNQRLSRFVVEQYGAWQLEQGQKVWQSLQCVSWQLWILDVYEQFVENQGLLLLSAEEELLWQSVIESIESGFDLINSQSFTQPAASAWNNLRHYQLDLDGLPADLPEHAIFNAWVHAYEARKAEGGFVDTVDCQLQVLNLLQHQPSLGFNEVILLGFDNFTPLQRSIIEALERSGVTISEENILLDADVCRTELVDFRQELLLAAQWAKKLLAQDPGLKLNIVVNNLAQVRPQVEEVFAEVFFPQRRTGQYPRSALPFNVSAAEPLSAKPIIDCALSLLSLDSSFVKIDLLSELIRSPFGPFYSESEPSLLWFSSVAKKYHKLSSKQLLAELSQGPFNQDIEQSVYKKFEAFYKSAGRLRAEFTQTMEFWVAYFADQLQVLGWPGARQLDSVEFQQWQLFSSLLEEAARYSRVLGPVDKHQALSLIKNSAYRPAHAQTKKSPIQILGILEALGSQCDQLWALGFSHNAWPEKIQPSPFIALAFQQAHSMPRSSAEQELALAQRITQRLAKSAYKVIFSSAQQKGDEPLAPSPLIEDYEYQSPQQICEGYFDQFQPSIFKGQHLESYDDDAASPVQDPESIRGGASLIRQQAACPFKAFARYRLVAQNPERMLEGISPALRGMLIHAALERIWGVLQNQAQLQQQNAEHLLELIQTCLKKAWLDLPETKEIIWPLRDLELQRAKGLISHWLELELERAPFKVKASEHSVSTTFKALPLKFRVDRIDEDDDGDLLIIDYKTSLNQLKAWEGDRPDDPQLPLYALTLDRVKAISYGQLHPKQQCFLGLGDIEGIPGLVSSEEHKLDLPKSWSEILESWRQVIEALVTAFLQGHAEVQPKQPSTTCLYCDLSPLCRIKHRSLS